MVYHRLFEWFLVFSKEWLIPKVALAFSVCTISVILFSVDKSHSISGVALDKFDGLFEITSSNIFNLALFIVYGAFFASLIANFYSKKKSRRWFFLEKRIPMLALAANTIFGLLLLPMIVALAAAFQSDGALPLLKAQLIFYVPVFLFFLQVLIILVHWISTRNIA